MPFLFLVVGWMLGSSHSDNRPNTLSIDSETMMTVSLYLAFALFGIAVALLTTVVIGMVKVTPQNMHQMFAVTDLFMGIALGWSMASMIPASACIVRLRTALILVALAILATIIFIALLEPSNMANGILGGAIAAIVISLIIIVVRGLKRPR